MARTWAEFVKLTLWFYPRCCHWWLHADMCRIQWSSTLWVSLAENNMPLQTEKSLQQQKFPCSSLSHADQQGAEIAHPSRMLQARSACPVECCNIVIACRWCAFIYLRRYPGTCHDEEQALLLTKPDSSYSTRGQTLNFYYVNWHSIDRFLDPVMSCQSHASGQANESLFCFGGQVSFFKQ